MFANNAPRECVEAGIDGSNKNDPTACRKLMESQFGGEFGPNNGQCPPGEYPGINDQGKQSCLREGTYSPGTGPNRGASGKQL